MSHLSLKSRFVLVMAALACLISTCFAGPNIADAFITTQIHHHKSWIQRHPTLTAVGVGVATHHALKVAARRDRMRGKRLNWAERHPTLTAIGAGAVTHHIIKKHTHG